MTTETTPNPGSQEAYERGCICARLDNARGRGYATDKEGNPVFVITQGCPLHAPEETT